MANFIPKIEYGSPTTTITFELPPEGDNVRQVITGNTNTTTSTSGVEQSQFNYNEETISPKFTFITEALKDAYETFFKDHGSKGLSFSYFEHSDEIEFITVTLERKTFTPTRMFPDNSGGFVYEFNMSMRHVL